MQSIGIQLIVRSGATQPRASLHEDVVNTYAERMEEGDTFPPVVVFFDGTTHWLADGFHRCQGAEVAGLQEISVETHSGTQQDARDYANSGKPNGRHGLRETKDDRHRRIANMLKDHPDWSLREVAGHCEVAPNTVKAVRDSICANCTDTPADNHDRTVTRNGTTYTMQTGGIGRSEYVEQPDDPPIEYPESAHSIGAADKPIDPGFNHLAQGTGQNEWYTPADIVDRVREAMGGIDLDPASNAEANETIRADRYFTKEDDGLLSPWVGKIWLNAPYSRDLMPAFVAKLVDEYQAKNVTDAILVSHNNTDTRWFQTLAKSSSAICFPSTRIKFYRGDEVAAPVNGQAFFYLGGDLPAFKSAFADMGVIVEVSA